MNKKTLTFGAIAIGLIAGVALILPVYLDPNTGPIPTKLRTLSDTKDYYSTVYYIFTLVIGLVGLVLGFFYYENRKKVDKEARDREHTRARLDALIVALDAYDRNVHAVLCLSCKDQKELDFIRSEILRIYDNVEAMMAEGLGLLGLSDDDMQKIIKVHSLVEKNRLIMHETLKGLTRNILYSERERYAERMKDARRACYLRLC